jgi:hypothetical protein
MRGNPSFFSSVHSHVAVAPVSSPIRATCGACVQNVRAEIHPEDFQKRFDAAAAQREYCDIFE